MHKVYIGYSLSMKSDELINYFDIDNSHEDLYSKFQQEFGSSRVIQGKFEVYGRDFYRDYDFNEQLLLKLLPFHLGENIIKQIDFYQSESIFYIELDKIDKFNNDDLFLIGPINIEKFDYE